MVKTPATEESSSHGKPAMAVSGSMSVNDVLASAQTDYTPAKGIASPLQTAPGKDLSIPFLFGILPKNTVAQAHKSLRIKEHSKGFKPKIRSNQKGEPSRQAHYTPEELSLRPQNNPLSGPKTRKWLKNSRRPISSHQEEMMNYLFNRDIEVSFLRQLEKEFFQANKNPVTPVEQNLSHSFSCLPEFFKPESDFEGQEDCTVDPKDLQEHVFKEYFYLFNRWNTLCMAIKNAHTSEQWLTDCYGPNIAKQFSKSFKKIITYDGRHQIIALDLTAHHIVWELINMGLCFGINSKSCGAMDSFPRPIKDFLSYLCRCKNDLQIQIVSAGPLFRLPSDPEDTHTIRYWKENNPSVFPSIIVLMEQEDIEANNRFEVNIEDQQFLTTNEKLRAAGLQHIEGATCESQFQLHQDCRRIIIYSKATDFLKRIQIEYPLLSDELYQQARWPKSNASPEGFRDSNPL